MSHLSTDCLTDILEYLEKEIVTLHSCLLVNRLWCEVSVRILWRDVRNYRALSYGTLISCLPNESKEILYKNGFIISTLNSKPPVFNYAEFCKILSIWRVNCDIKQFLVTQKLTSPQNLNDNTCIVEQEIFKLFINQISSLKVLDYSLSYPNINISITSYPGAKDCLKNLSELDCCSNIYPEFFYQLSKICHKIQTLKITLEKNISNELTDLISVQQNLKYLTIMNYYDHEISLKLPNTLIKLNLTGERHKQLSFITNLTNLQVLALSFNTYHDFEDFKTLQYATFSQLKVLKIQDAIPKYELLIKFLENNGKNLKEFYIGDNQGFSNDSLNLAIAKFCTNLCKLSTGFKYYEVETLKMIFNSCQYLESIKIWCGDEYLDENEAFKLIVSYSPKHVYELILHYPWLEEPELLPEELESFFLNWSNHRQKKSLTFMISKYDKDDTHSLDENMKIIEKYTKLGVVKEFGVIDFNNGRAGRSVHMKCENHFFNKVTRQTFIDKSL